jgi:hypothetical protein
MQAELHPPVRGAFDAKKANHSSVKVRTLQQVQPTAGGACNGAARCNFWQTR